MPTLYVYVAILATIVYAVYQYINNGLRKFPGPFLARFTNAWKVFDAVTTWHRKPTIIELHQQYGDVVRTGPDYLSFAQPQAIQDIYGTDKHFGKSGLYSAAAAVVRGRPTPSLFSSLDTAWHDNLRRAIQPAFNLTALVQYEPFVNKTLSMFIEQLNKRYANKPGEDGVVDLSRWLHWYAFDVIGEVTYGHAFGFLESGSDVAGIIADTNHSLTFSYTVGQMPWLDKVLHKNPILLWVNRHGWFNNNPNPAVTWALKHQTARVKAIEEGKHDVTADGRVDLMDKFLQAKEKHPDTITDKEVLGLGMSMVFAGSETTAITLSAIFYYLLKNPPAYKKLRTEIDNALGETDKSSPVPFQTALKLPYLDACVKEAFRIHPAARFAAERVIPASGATIAGHDIPAGTVVGVNAWVLHRRAGIFGQDLESYKPERWLAGSEEDPQIAKAQITEMNRHLFQFGTGKFNCIGQHISRLEMYKAVPSLVRVFDFELADPKKEWKLGTGSFLNVSEVDVRIKRR